MGTCSDGVHPLYRVWGAHFVWASILSAGLFRRAVYTPVGKEVIEETEWYQITSTEDGAVFSDRRYVNILMNRGGLFGVIGNHYAGGGFKSTTLQQFLDGERDWLVEDFCVEHQATVLAKMKEHARRLLGRDQTV